MEIEYKRELTKSYMCVKTDQDFLPFEKEILTRSSILGIVPVNTIFADAATVCWYDITGMQAFDHALETGNDGQSDADTVSRKLMWNA